MRTVVRPRWSAGPELGISDGSTARLDVDTWYGGTRNLLDSGGQS